MALYSSSPRAVFTQSRSSGDTVSSTIDIGDREGIGYIVGVGSGVSVGTRVAVGSGVLVGAGPGVFVG